MLEILLVRLLLAIQDRCCLCEIALKMTIMICNDKNQLENLSLTNNLNIQFLITMKIINN